MGQERILLQNIQEFVREAQKAKLDGAYNSATTLFFKALAVSVDFFILKKEGFIPSNHTERFRILKEKYPFLYKIMDKDFPIYQDSYRLKISKQIVEVLEKDVQTTSQMAGIKDNK
ncbi:MAG TPA: hypothetical protein VJH95_02880 [Candidatus Nanoarchaeia archaeon]|nr:hypothetical protein [Candidatus Nanoarchaeia archaeon]